MIITNRISKTQKNENLDEYEIRREIDNEQVSRRNICIFLANNRGHYFACPANPNEQISNMLGWVHFLENNPLSKQKLDLHSKSSGGNAEGKYTMYKTIDNIYLSRSDGSFAKTEEVVNDYCDIARISDLASEKFSILKSGMLYTLKLEPGQKATVNVDLDFREIFDYDDTGRIYSIYEETIPAGKIISRLTSKISSKKSSKKNRNSKLMIVEYKKYSDNTLKNLKHTYYLAIYMPDFDFEILNKWEKRNYLYDASRNTRSEFYIYRALRILCNNVDDAAMVDEKGNMNFYFAYAEKKDTAISKIMDLINSQNDVWDIQNEFIEGNVTEKFKAGNLTTENCSAYIHSSLAVHSMLMSLSINGQKFSGLWAGLPWFFQFWSRDELIATGYLLSEKNYAVMKDILFRHLNNVMSDGRLESVFPVTGLGSADAVGWLFKRLYDLINETKLQGVFDKLFTLSDVKYIHQRLEYSIRQHMKNHFKQDMIYNDKLETWMDTFYSDGTYDTDYREGFRIEMQALFLIMLKLINQLNVMLANKLVKKSDKLVVPDSEFDEFMKMESSLKSLVKEKYLVRLEYGEFMLMDGYKSSYDNVSRPNIFLAFYLYRELLTDEEWNCVFDYALDHLWCEWMLTSGKTGGGLSTIDKKHFLYQPTYSGQNNRSYHRGDSWFWINNIAAICLIKLDRHKYEYYINKIFGASTEDILYSGFPGYASELTSSGMFKPGGCFAQTWSSSTYVELYNLLNNLYTK